MRCLRQRKTAPRCYIKTTIPDPTYLYSPSPNPRYDSGDTAKLHCISQHYPRCVWRLLVSSQACRIYPKSHPPHPAFRWDYCITLWVEIFFVSGRLKLRWPLVCPLPAYSTPVLIRVDPVPHHPLYHVSICNSMVRVVFKENVWATSNKFQHCFSNATGAAEM